MPSPASCGSRHQPWSERRAPTVRVWSVTPRQTSALLRLAQQTLPHDLVGVYLHGSAVLGGLRPDSNLDVLVVSRRSLEKSERIALLNGLLDISGRRARRIPGRPVKLTVVVDADVNPWRYPARVDFQYGEWLRSDYERG